MKHITYSDKNLLTGDEAADMLVRYAAALANVGAADTVSLECLGPDGDAVTATFLVGEGAPLMAETTTGKLEEPDNESAISYMKLQISRLGHNSQGRTSDSHWDEELARPLATDE